MNLVFMVEDLSTKRFLEALLPRIDETLSFRVIPHEGKSDLEKSLPRKLKAWLQPDTYFVIVRDQDSGDCHAIKAGLRAICAESGRPDALIRIACRELEAWYFGDLATVSEVLKAPQLARLQHRRQYRDLDRLGSPSQELRRLAPGFGKVSAAPAIGAAINLQESNSQSFKAFLDGVRGLVSQ